MKTRAFLGIFLSLVFSGTCMGGWLDTTLEGVGKKLGNRGVNDAGNSAYDAAKGAVRDPAKDKPANGQGSSSQISTSSSKTGRKGMSQATSDSPATIEEAEAVYSKFDFVPGDKTICFDDFSDTDVGEFPRKWTLDGPKHNPNNAVEVVEYQGRKFLRSAPGTKARGQDSATQYVRLNKKGDLPEKFTVEFDAILGDNGKGGSYGKKEYTLLLSKGKSFHWAGDQKGSFMFSQEGGHSVNTKTGININDNKAHHIAVSVNGTFVKGYVDNIRVINDPDGVERPIERVGVYMRPWNGSSENQMFTNFRLAEGGKDVKAALDTDGKIVTHGILFDTGKDTLKPESLPTLKRILALLTDDPGLKFSVEGHTDSQGNRGINQPLSERRSEAVMNWLAGKGIDPSRLAAKGFGDTVPIDTNKTPEGRANNRRVEFVKF